jgi:uncharacterized protein YdeI (YjbR/CyaY-like superfamily)
VAPTLGSVDLRTRKQWRAWLAKHHASSPGVWLVRHKRHTGVESMSLDELQREALCFGWIDSLVKRLDDDRFAIKVTPRKPTSRWSELNLRRWRELDASVLLAPAGREAAPTANAYAPRPKVPLLPAYVAAAFRSNAKAWKTFQALPPRERRNYVVWIHTAKRPETRERRIRESIARLAAGEKLGLK